MQILNQSKVHIPEFSVSSDICLPLQSKQAFLFPKLMLPHLQCTIKETLLFMKIIHVKENTNKKKFKAVYNNAIYTPLTIIINFFLWHLFSWIRHHDVDMLLIDGRVYKHAPIRIFVENPICNAHQLESVL